MEDMITPWRVEADERNYEVNGNFTPDTYIAGYNIYDAVGDEVVGCEGIIDQTEDRAAHIVQCVNSHASLVEENKRMREALEGIKAFAATARKSNLLSSPFEDRTRRDIWVKARYEVGKKIYEMARAALGDTNA